MYCSAESCTLQRWNFKSYRDTDLSAPWDQLHPKPEYLPGSFRADQQVHLPTKKAKKSVNTQSSKCKQKVAGLPSKQILRPLPRSQEVFCETDELWVEIHQQSLQPLVATRIFLLKKRAGSSHPTLGGYQAASETQLSHPKRVKYWTARWKCYKSLLWNGKRAFSASFSARTYTCAHPLLALAHPCWYHNSGHPKLMKH